MKRHAYLILAHKNFTQLRKLVELLDDSRNDIFIHVDKKARFNPDEWKDACKYSSLSFIEPLHRAPYPCKLGWGQHNEGGACPAQGGYCCRTL